MAILLSLSAALSYGLSDFLGGVLSRRISPWVIAFASMVGGALMMLALGLVRGGEPTATAWSWALLAGLGNGIGTAFLYRGLSTGQMGVIAPISGVGAAVLPVAVGVVAGERPSGLAWLGIVTALPAIFLVAREPSVSEPDRTATPGAIVDGVVAGLGFGTLFAALAQIPDSAGLLPLALNQLVGAMVVAIGATLLGAAWLPRQPLAAAGLICGSLGALATLLFLLATREGLLTISAVLTSLYPAGTVALAVLVLHERVRASQGVGLLLCGVAIALIAAG